MSVCVWVHISDLDYIQAMFLCSLGLGHMYEGQIILRE